MVGGGQTEQMLRKTICIVKRGLFCSNGKKSIGKREKRGGRVGGFFHFVFVLGSAPAMLNMFCLLIPVRLTAIGH